MATNINQNKVNEQPQVSTRESTTISGDRVKEWETEPYYSREVVVVRAPLVRTKLLRKANTLDCDHDLLPKEYGLSHLLTHS